jgi:phosphatidylglycerophosphatase A
MKRSPKVPMPLGTRLAASFFLIGEAAPFAPATFASAAVLPLLYYWWTWSVGIQLLITVVVSVLGIWWSTKAEDYYGHDGSAIVIDEVAGMLVTFLWLPMAVGDERIKLLVIGFFLFRFFDIVKPFPANKAQDLPKGWGVMCDDLIAGIYASIGLRLIDRFLLS